MLAWIGEDSLPYLVYRIGTDRYGWAENFAESMDAMRAMVSARDEIPIMKLFRALLYLGQHNGDDYTFVATTIEELFPECSQHLSREELEWLKTMKLAAVGSWVDDAIPYAPIHRVDPPEGLQRLVIDELARRG